MAEFFAEGFADDDLYRYMLKDSKKKNEAMRKYFESYLKFFGIAATMVAVDGSLQCCGVVFYPSGRRSAIAQLGDTLVGSLHMLGLLKIVGPSTFNRVVSTSLNMTSGWIEECVDWPYIHIDMLVTRKESRNKGLATSLIKRILEQADEAKQPVTLETQNPSNVALYSKFGFETVKTMSYGSLTEYCMVRR